MPEPKVELAELQRIRRERQLHARWPAELEAAYRDYRRRHHRIPRSLLFTIHGLLIGAAPWYGQPIFLFDPRGMPALAIVLNLVGAAVLGVAWLTYRHAGSRLAKIAQAIAVHVLGLGAVALHYLATQRYLEFTPLMVCVVVTSLLAFGGYSRQRMVIGGTVCFALSVLVEMNLEAGQVANVRSFGLVLMGLTAVMAVIALDIIARSAWIDHRCAALLGSIDPLTGLGTRADFNQQIGRRFQQARRYGHRIAILLLDIDHFKQLNDGHGHLFGDEVLREVGALISRRHAMRSSDLKIRFGGEEMLILWYDVDATQVQALTQALLDDLRQLLLHEPLRQQAVRITASAGVTHLIPDAATEPLAVLRRADELLYQAKAQGRDRAVIEAYRPA